MTIDLDKTSIDISGDLLQGSITFHKIPVQLKSIELVLLRIETTGTEKSTNTITKFEVVDGSPSNEQIIPIRFIIAGQLAKKLTRTMHRVRNVLNVAYYLDFVFIDEQNRRFFKQLELVMKREIVGHQLLREDLST